MVEIPSARLGAPRRADRPIGDHTQIKVNLSLPGWVASALYGAARRDHRTVSSVAILALADFLEISEPDEVSGG